MIRSRHENRKPFAPNFLKIPTHQHRCNKVTRSGQHKTFQGHGRHGGIRRAAARGEALGDDLGAVTGTSLDKGVELDALAKLPKDERKGPKITAVDDGRAEITIGPSAR